MIRTFIALEIPFPELQKIIQIRDKVVGYDKSIRWESVDKLHITLKFMGDTDESKLPVIKDELLNIFDAAQTFDLSFSKYGVFKKSNDPKILWIGLNESKQLNVIVEKIQDSFTKFGYTKEEKIFKPHITLLRFKGYEDKSKIMKLLEVKVPNHSFEANIIHLYKSELKPTGSVYTSLQKYLLTK